MIVIWGEHLVCKDSNQAAINAGDRVDSALKMTCSLL